MRSWIVLLGLFFIGMVSGADIYVAPPVIEQSTSGVTGSDLIGDGSFDNPYGSIQNALFNMNIGDTIYLRGGTYREDNTEDPRMTFPSGDFGIDIEIPPSLSGDSWEPGHYNTITSYPGEWAVVDGEGSAPGGKVLGYPGMSGGEYHYWKFERFEITGGCLSGSGGAGLWLVGGPFIVRHMYIHDNWADTDYGNPGGIVGYRLQNSTIEYNYFYRNGAADQNGGMIILLPDYNDESQGQDDLVDIARAQYGNNISYNYFLSGGTHSGIKNKGSQMLGPNIASAPDGEGWSRKEMGDKMHHNIFIGFSDGWSSNIRQDFAQFYNNVLVDSSMSSSESNQYGRRRQCFYNNLMIGGGFNQFNKERPTEWAPPTYYSEDYLYNNIFDAYVEGTGGMSYPIVYGSGIAFDYISSINSVFDRGAFLNNYVYRPGRSGDMFSIVSQKIGEDPHFERFTVDEYDSMFLTSNYFKVSSEGNDNLMIGSSGADRYITRGAHVVEDSVTVADGGVGGAHPYLDGVVLPSYIGAVNPDDSDWVAGVLGLTDVDYLMGADGDPDWIEGAVPVAGCESDGDGDGYGVGASCLGLDCDDDDGLVWANVSCVWDGVSCGEFELCLASCPVVPVEVCGDSIDQDCDGSDLVCVCAHDADLEPCDGVVSVEELEGYIGLWLVGGKTISEVMSAVNVWLH